MRVRTVIVGVVCGLICLVALQFQYYKIEPYRFVPGWPAAALAARLPSWLSAVMLVFCGITLFTGGWVAARWNWAQNWRRSLQAGASMGLLAGCLIFDFIGTTWSGVRANAAIFANFYNDVPTNAGIGLMADALVQAGKLLYLNSILILLVCMLVGGLGAITSTLVDKQDLWGSDPRNPEGWLFRLPTYLLALFGPINLIISSAVLITFQGSLARTVEKVSAMDTIHVESPQLFSLLSNVSLWLFAFVPLGVTWGWTFKLWRRTRRVRIMGVIWLLITTVGFLFLFWFIAPDIIEDWRYVSLLIVCCAAGVYVGYSMQERTEGFAYRFSDWVGFCVGYGILSGTQLISGIVAIALIYSTLTVSNMAHIAQSQPPDLTYDPVRQVLTLYSLQFVAAAIAIGVSILASLIIAGFVSFWRTIFDVRDVAFPSDEESEYLRAQP